VSFRYRNIRRDSNEILDLAETLAAKKKLRLVICFDEFQNITQFRKADNIEDHLRSVGQNHQHVTYTLYGSKRTILTDIFENSGRPFFRFGDIILLDKIPAEDWYPYLQRHFSNSGKKLAAEAARRIVAEVEGHTYYVQQLAHEVWLHGSDHVWEKDVEEAMATLVERNSPLYENQLDHLSATQVNLIKAAAAGIKQFTSVKTMRDYRLGTPNNVRQNKAVLEREEIIEFERRGGEFLDPVFLRWFREIYQIKPANKDEDY
jgi:AAA+ ATPase superfamily predicted ATPase